MLLQKNLITHTDHFNTGKSENTHKSREGKPEGWPALRMSKLHLKMSKQKQTNKKTTEKKTKHRAIICIFCRTD